MTFTFKHPKYYKELRDAGTELAKRNAVKQHLDLYPGSSPVRNKSDQVISESTHDGESERAPGPGHKPQASTKLVNACIDQRELQAPSSKQQAPSAKLQEKI